MLRADAPAAGSLALSRSAAEVLASRCAAPPPPPLAPCIELLWLLLSCWGPGIGLRFALVGHLLLIWAYNSRCWWVFCWATTRVTARVACVAGPPLVTCNLYVDNKYRATHVYNTCCFVVTFILHI